RSSLFAQVTVAADSIIVRIVIGGDLFKVYFVGLLGLLPILVYIGVLENFKQPRFCISSRVVLIDKPVGLQVGLLHEIVGIVLIVREVIGKGLQGPDVGEELPLKNLVVTGLIGMHCRVWNPSGESAVKV